ncbi:MAG TPA: CoA transferase, partial [Burkholderiaceae bacterium]|nr:CoA transferase [Burkholderiaceae bacterium]
KTVMLGLQNEREWKVFCEKVLLQPGLAIEERFSTNARRSAQREVLASLILQAFSGLTATEVAQRLETAGIANARVNTMAEVWAHPQLKARGRWTEVGTPAGNIPALIPPGSWQHGAPRMDAVPALGQHTEAILGKFGYSSERIAELRKDGVV